jgi:hypothetical protein
MRGRFRNGFGIVPTTFQILGRRRGEWFEIFKAEITWDEDGPQTWPGGAFVYEYVLREWWFKEAGDMPNFEAGYVGSDADDFPRRVVLQLNPRTNQ